MYRIFSLIVFLLIACFTATASDTVIVHKDMRLDLLTDKQTAINKLTSKMTNSGLYRGYRVQILNTRSRDDAFKLKAELLQTFPSHQTYVVFQSPYFKVRVGNFLDRSDAVAFKNQSLKAYTNNAYIVEDVIEYNSGEFGDTTSN